MDKSFVVGKGTDKTRCRESSQLLALLALDDRAAAKC
jgi:hypothetical protein